MSNWSRPLLIVGVHRDWAVVRWARLAFSRSHAAGTIDGAGAELGGSAAGAAETRLASAAEAARAPTVPPAHVTRGLGSAAVGRVAGAS